MDRSLAQLPQACQDVRARGPQNVLESPAFLYLARLSPGSRRAQREALIRLTTLGFGLSDPFKTPWHSLTVTLCATLRAELIARYAPATARRHMAALRGVIKEAWRQGLLDSETRDRLLDMPPVKGYRVGAGRMLTQDEIRQLYQKATCKDRAVLALCLWAGLRRAEASCLTVQNIGIKSVNSMPATTIPPVRGGGSSRWIAVRVLGKGFRERLVELVGPPADDLEAWCRVAPANGTLLALTPTGLWKALRRLGKRAGVKFTPHDLRRTYASLSLDQGTDLATVQALMGHKNPATTASYDRRGETARQKAAEGLSRVADLCYGSDYER